MTVTVEADGRLKFAIEHDDPADLKQFLQAHDSYIDRIFPEFQDRTLLHRACDKNKFQCCKVLLDFGASPNVQGLVNYETPLHLAAAQGHEECVLALLQHGKIRLDIQDVHKKTALHVAAINCSSQVLDKMLQLPFDASQRDQCGRTAAEYAREKDKHKAAAKIDHAVKRELQRKQQTLVASLSPQAGCPSSDPVPECKNLPVPIFNQLQWMIQYSGSLREDDIEDRLLERLRCMKMVEALDRLRKYDCERPMVRLSSFISEASTLSFAEWSGLQTGKPFGFLRDSSTGTRVFFHCSQVTDIQELELGDRVQFIKEAGRKGPEARQVQLVQSTTTRSHVKEVLWCTNGGKDRDENAFFPPRLMLMTDGEVEVMKENGMQTQAVQDLSCVDCPFLEKVYLVRRPECCNPPPASLFSEEEFSDPSAQRGAQDLAAVKNKLDEKDIKVWKAHTKKTLITSNVVNTIRKEIDAEMTTIAWAKMYEMLCAFDLVPIFPDDPSPVFNTLHVCEAPGAFICATNHYIRHRFPQATWNWMGCTLNPYYEGNTADAMVEDDAFINETMDNWYFGQDDSGDMRLPGNIAGTWKKAKAMGEVMLVTADGSIDCSDRPNDQEAVVAQLHYCEAVAALGALAHGGSFVLKMFTLFEHSSLGLLALLSFHFKQVFICKPVMSTPGNGETYIVCKGFQGIEEDVLDRLLSHTGKEWPCFEDGREKAILPRSYMGEDWMRMAVAGACYFAKLQAAVIQRNLNLFDEFSKAQGEQINEARRIVAYEWLRRFRIARIHPTQRIAQGTRLQGNRNRTGIAGPGRKRGEGNLKEREEAYSKKRKIREGGDIAGDLQQSASLTDAGSGVASEQADEHISDFAKKMMAKMGHKEGQGLGRDGQGIAEPIKAEIRGGRSGLAYGTSEKLGRDRLLPVASDSIIWLGTVFGDVDGVRKMLFENVSDNMNHLDERWIKTGARPLETTQSKVCDADAILAVLDARTQLERILRSRTKSTLRNQFGCYKLAVQGFASRAALKLADLAEVLADVNKATTILDPLANVSFVDFYSGKGGFSDYLLWKFGPRVQHALTIRRDGKCSPNTKEFRSDPAIAQRLRVCDVNGQDVKGGSLEDFAHLLAHDFKHVHGAIGLVLGDGVVKKTANGARARTVELLSINTFWTQCWSALQLLQQGGTFICQVTDTISRCMSGSTFLLTSCFERVTIIRPTTNCPAKSKRFLVCLNFKGADDECVGLVTKHIAKALQASSIAANEHGSELDVVEIVPWRQILQNQKIGNFVTNMAKLNQRDLGHETEAIRALEEDPSWNFAGDDVFFAELQRIGLEPQRRGIAA